MIFSYSSDVKEVFVALPFLLRLSTKKSPVLAFNLNDPPKMVHRSTRYSCLMNDSERREFMSVLLENVQIYEERQPNGQWLKSMEFKLPIIKEDMKLRLDNDSNVEMVVALTK